MYLFKYQANVFLIHQDGKYNLVGSRLMLEIVVTDIILKLIYSAPLKI